MPHAQALYQWTERVQRLFPDGGEVARHAAGLLGGGARGGLAAADRPPGAGGDPGVVCLADVDRARLQGVQERLLAGAADTHERPAACGASVGGAGGGDAVAGGGGRGGAGAEPAAAAAADKPGAGG